MDELVIEAALNGNTSRHRNPRVPVRPEQVAADAIACLAAGATIIHNHIEDYALNGAAAADEFEAGWRPVLARFPGVIFSPTASAGATVEQRWAHNAILADRGLSEMAWLDPGSLNTSYDSGPDGLPGVKGGVYQNTFEDIAYQVEQMRRYGLGPSVAIFEPGFLRLALAYHRNGRMPRGALIRFYFGGDHNPMTGVKGGLSFGLPPTPAGLAAYLEMMGDCRLPWMVAVAGGDAAASGVARLAMERGGHVRVGLEDYAGPRQPSNLELVREIVEIAREVGRPVADCAAARRIIDLPRGGRGCRR